MNEQVQAWFWVLQHIKEQTDGFTRDVWSIPKSEAVFMRPVPYEMIDFAPVILKIIHPKHHVEAKQVIGYLIELNAMQGQLWQEIQAEIDAASELIENCLSSNDIKTSVLEFLNHHENEQLQQITD